MKLAQKIPLIAAVVCFAVAAFLNYALIGYETLALTFAGIGVVILLFLIFTKILKIILIVILCVGLLIFGAAEFPVLQAAGGDPDADADYLIVLGAGVNGSTPSLSMVNRLTAALDYLNAHPDCTAVVSGGQGEGEDITEAQAMYDWLTARGIAPERVVREEKATSTLENLQFSIALIPEAQRASIAVVSSEYHLYRAKLLAKVLGYDVLGVPAETTLPVLKLNYFIREALGVMYYTVFPADA